MVSFVGYGTMHITRSAFAMNYRVVLPTSLPNESDAICRHVNIDCCVYHCACLPNQCVPDQVVNNRVRISIIYINGVAACQIRVVPCGVGLRYWDRRSPFLQVTIRHMHASNLPSHSVFTNLAS